MVKDLHLQMSSGVVTASACSSSTAPSRTTASSLVDVSSGDLRSIDYESSATPCRVNRASFGRSKTDGKVREKVPQPRRAGGPARQRKNTHSFLTTPPYTPQLPLPGLQLHNVRAHSDGTPLWHRGRGSSARRHGQGVTGGVDPDQRSGRLQDQRGAHQQPTRLT